MNTLDLMAGYQVVAIGKAGQGKTIQSVERALEIIEFLASAEGEVQLREVSAATGLNLSTCHHLLSTLVSRGYAGRNPRRRSYFIGRRIQALAERRLKNFNILEAAMPALRELNAATRECVHLDALQGSDLVTLAQLESTLPVRAISGGSGMADAAHATASGKAILAWLPEPEIKRICEEKGLRRFTGDTIAAFPELIEHFRNVRRNGYAIDRGEFRPDVTSVGSAIRNRSGAVIGAIGCSMPSMRADRQHREAAAHAVRAAAGRMSALLGRKPGRRAANSSAA